MKKLSLGIITLLASVFCLASVATVSAVDILNPVCIKGGASSTVCKENDANSSTNPLFGPEGVLTIVMKWLARIVGIAAVLVIAVSGLTLAFSGGEANEAATARRTIGFAAIGLVVALFAQAIVSFVLSKL